MNLVPAFSSPTTCLYTGDAITTLAELPAASVDCVVTSPPFYGLRDYQTATWSGGDPRCPHTHNTGRAPRREGGPCRCADCGAVRTDQQYGLEPTPADYVDTLRRLFAHLRRVLAPTGTVWLNLGDSYSAPPPGRSTRPMRRSTLDGAAAAGTAREQVRSAGLDRTRTVPRKNLLGMPWRVALALQADGWVLRNAVVWAKRNPMPESVKDRLSTTYEFVFLLTTNPAYYFDLDAIRAPLRRPEALGEGILVGGNRPTHGTLLGASGRRRSGSVYGKYHNPTAFARGAHGAALTPTGQRHDTTHPRGKNPGDVWQISTRPLREAHFAAFPIDLPLRCIAAGCPPNGVVLDPFSGAATTGLAALHLGRRYIGIELNPAYNHLANRRLLDADGRTGTAKHPPTTIEPGRDRQPRPPDTPVSSGQASPIIAGDNSLDPLTPPGVDGRPPARPATNHPDGRATPPRSPRDQEPTRTADPCPHHPHPTPEPGQPAAIRPRPTGRDTSQRRSSSSDTAGPR